MIFLFHSQSTNSSVIIFVLVKNEGIKIHRNLIISSFLHIILLSRCFRYCIFFIIHPSHSFILYLKSQEGSGDGSRRHLNDATHFRYLKMSYLSLRIVHLWYLEFSELRKSIESCEWRLRTAKKSYCWCQHISEWQFSHTFILNSTSLGMWLLLCESCYLDVKWISIRITWSFGCPKIGQGLVWVPPKWSYSGKT
jgi:hypothetical protein